MSLVHLYRIFCQNKKHQLFLLCHFKRKYSLIYAWNIDSTHHGIYDRVHTNISTIISFSGMQQNNLFFEGIESIFTGFLSEQKRPIVFAVPL